MIEIKATSNKYFLHFYEKKIALKFCELLAFRNRILKIDLESHFSTKHSGLEIVTINKQRELLIFETKDIIILRDLINSIFSPKELETYKI